jgi:hypothetical protein
VALFLEKMMEKFCENHPLIAALLFAPMLYALLWLSMALF